MYYQQQQPPYEDAMVPWRDGSTSSTAAEAATNKKAAKKAANKLITRGLRAAALSGRIDYAGEQYQYPMYEGLPMARIHVPSTAEAFAYARRVLLGEEPEEEECEEAEEEEEGDGDADDNDDEDDNAVSVSVERGVEGRRDVHSASAAHTAATATTTLSSAAAAAPASIVLGFDTETRPSHGKVPDHLVGPHLVQFATADEAFLIQLGTNADNTYRPAVIHHQKKSSKKAPFVQQQRQGLAWSLVRDVMMAPHVTKVGFALGGDISKFIHLFSPPLQSGGGGGGSQKKKQKGGGGGGGSSSGGPPAPSADAISAWARKHSVVDVDAIIQDHGNAVIRRNEGSSGISNSNSTNSTNDGSSSSTAASAREVLLAGGAAASPASTTSRAAGTAVLPKPVRFPGHIGIYTAFAHMFHCVFAKDKRITVSDWTGLSHNGGPCCAEKGTSLRAEQLLYAAADAHGALLVYQRLMEMLPEGGNTSPSTSAVSVPSSAPPPTAPPSSFEAFVASYVAEKEARLTQRAEFRAEARAVGRGYAASSPFPSASYDAAVNSPNGEGEGNRDDEAAAGGEFSESDGVDEDDDDDAE